MFEFWLTSDNLDNLIIPVSIILFSWSNAFQLIIGFILSVLTPNFTSSFVLTDSDEVKIITPCWFFSPVHPFSVLNDLKLNSSPNQTLKVLISLSELFVAVIIAVSSNPMLTTLTSSA